MKIDRPMAAWPFIAVALLAATVQSVLAQEPETYTLTLGDAARLAAERSAEVREARSRADGAAARVRQNTADLLPDLSADVVRGQRTFNTASFGLDFPTQPGQEPFFDPEGELVGPVKSADVRLRAEVPLLDLEALGRRRSAAAGAAAAQEEVRAIQAEAAAMAARSYLAVVRAREEVEAREEDLRLAEELAGVARAQLDAGIAITLDVTRAEAQVATVRAQGVTARHRAESSELVLRRVLRLSDEDTLDLTDDLEKDLLAIVPEDEAVTLALGSRRDLDVAEAHRASAEHAVSADRAARFGRISASVDDGYYGRRFGHTLNTYTWSLRLSVPIFDGFARSAELDEDRARVRELDFRIEDLKRDVQFQVRQALLSIDAQREQLEAMDERLRLATLEVEQEEERLRAGVAGTGDVVRAALRLIEARTGRLDAVSGLRNAQLALAAAMGTVTDLP